MDSKFQNISHSSQGKSTINKNKGLGIVESSGFSVVFLASEKQKL